MDGLTLNGFFDSGCGNMIKKSAVEHFANLGRAKQVLAGPFEITGVGNRTTVWEGVFCRSLPLNTGGNALSCGICLPEITSEFPLYDLTELEKDIRKKCYDIGNEDLVSKLPECVCVCVCVCGGGGGGGGRATKGVHKMTLTIHALYEIKWLQKMTNMLFTFI